MYDANDFVEGSVWAVNKDYPGQYSILYWSSWNDVPGAPGWQTGFNSWPQDTWFPRDCSDYVHPEAKAVKLQILMLLTSGTTPMTGNFTLGFRRHGAPANRLQKGNGWLNPPDHPVQALNNHYTGQVAGVSNGVLSISPNVRSPFYCEVALDEDKKFDAWLNWTGTAIPNDTIYGLNVNIAGYLR